MVKEFCHMLKNEPADWFSGFTFYQFRDDGRLGLEITDPNNPTVGIEQPVLKTYKEIIHNEYFLPSITTTKAATFPATLRWGSSEDADGLALPITFEKNPVFFEAYFDEDIVDLNLMVEVNGRWFYKAPGVKCIDMIPAFFDKPLAGPCELTLRLFAPPATGENDSTQGDDWTMNYYATIKKLPSIRLRYEPIEL